MSQDFAFFFPSSWSGYSLYWWSTVVGVLGFRRLLLRNVLRNESVVTASSCLFLGCYYLLSLAYFNLLGIQKSPSLLLL